MQNHSIPNNEKSEKDGILEMVISSFEVDSISPEGYYPIALHTSRGVVFCRYYAAEDKEKAVIFIGGEEGGWDTPMRSSLYPHLSEMLAKQGINCLRIQYRHSIQIAESMLDVLAGITFLAQEGITSIGIVGYALGATIAIQTAAASAAISTVVAISPKIFGFNAIASLHGNQSFLILHGTDDSTTSTLALSWMYHYGQVPKKIIHYSRAGRKLDEVAPEASRVVKDWLRQYVA